MSDYASELATRSVWELKLMADCMDPDTSTSPGAVFLDDVRSEVLDFIRTDGMNPDTLRDEASVIAGRVVECLESRGTYRKWLTFVDLGAWQEELADLGYEYRSDAGGLSAGADMALYMIADRLVHKIADEWEESLTDGDDDAELHEDKCRRCDTFHAVDACCELVKVGCPMGTDNHCQHCGQCGGH